MRISFLDLNNPFVTHYVVFARQNGKLLPALSSLLILIHGTRKHTRQHKKMRHVVGRFGFLNPQCDTAMRR